MIKIYVLNSDDLRFQRKIDCRFLFFLILSKAQIRFYLFLLFLTGACAFYIF